MAEENGVWRTVRGRRVWIEDGQSLNDAMEKSGKFNNLKNDETEKLKEMKEKIGSLVEIGLNYNVDYVYILEDIQKLLEGKDVKINTENYID